MRAEAADTYTANKVWYVTIDRSVNLPFGSLINSASRVGNGFEIRNCIAGPNRSRGILVKSSNGIITNNTCINNWGNGIKCSPEYEWFEGPSGSNVEISNNTITGCRDQSISILAIGGNGNNAPAGAHDNIRIFNNVISGALAFPAFELGSISNLCFYSNTYNIGNSQVSVTNVTFPTVTSIAVAPTNTALTVTQTTQLTATVLPSSICNRSVKWTSDKPLVAKVDSLT
ncbi:MAG: Ig-like domain-containing protein, partial [Chitinophagaceae bacterium]